MWTISGPKLDQSGRICRIGIAVASCLVLAGCSTVVRPKAVAAPPAEALPYFDRITAVVKSVDYSGYHAMVNPEVALNIDFANQTWSLSNLFKYDSQGEILLEEGRYGLCGRLAAHVYRQIKPWLQKEFEIKFIQAAEPTFFSGPRSSHMILAMVNKNDGRQFFIDPSFHKYGTKEVFSGYQFLEIRDSLSMFADRATGLAFKLGQAHPLLIREGLLVSFSVTSVDDKFDLDNFFLAITVNRPYEIIGKDIAVIGRYNGRFESFQDPVLLNRLLRPDEVDKIYKKFHAWLKKLFPNEAGQLTAAPG
ncbi:MAG: hypothetical protein HQL23_07165 [Candidatus Omnitrophica bacterium]|nr:hypothetical protein [Candidatus Omnitrophota bacterium]